MKVAGVDTHKEAHALCVLDERGKIVFEGEFEACESGYAQIARAIGEPASCQGVGIEGTSTYGAGLAVYLMDNGYAVYEVLCPKRPRRRPGQNKNDLADAERAARDVLMGANLSSPKPKHGWVERARLLHTAREQAVKTQTAMVNAARSALVTAPDRLRGELDQKSPKGFMESLLVHRETSDAVERSALDALECYARIWRTAAEMADGARRQLKELMAEHALPLMEMAGSSDLAAAKIVIAAGDCGERIRSEAAFASFCGVAPVEASSGKVCRHRLNRGGNRQANRTLYMMVITRMRYDDRTKAYVEKRTKEGLSKKEIIRCLKRYVAREVYRALKKCS